ncbi:Chromate resistance protein ChrB [Nocardia vinacea]|uniref:Chromate resistance protein ChrB n=1 Tax=Nocardia vinacea TaxID=96468 RepID=UPI003402A7B0
MWAAPDVSVFSAVIAQALELTEKAGGETISLRESSTTAYSPTAPDMVNTGISSGTGR